MTIRILCAECQRKLKVPDEALGKKVQCPSCGARFIGRLDAAPPAAPPLESPPPLQHPPLEMMAASTFEETPPPEEPVPAPSPLPEPASPLSPLSNLQLDAPTLDVEPVEPVAIEHILPTAPPLESAPLQHPPLEIMAAATFEETPAPEEPALAPSPLPEPAPPPSPFLNLELDAPSLDVEAVEPAEIEPVEPLAVDEVVAEEPLTLEDAVAEEPLAVDEVVVEDPIVVEDALAEDPIVVEDAAVDPIVVEEAVEPLDPIILDDETTDEVEEVEEAVEKRPKKKKSRGLLCGCLAAVALLMLAGCGVGGFFGYRMYYGTISDSDWKQFTVPGGGCFVRMPGDPVSSTEPLASKGTKFKYTVEKPWSRSEFHVLYWDLPDSKDSGSFEARIDMEAAHLCNRLGGTMGPKRPFPFRSDFGREMRLDLTGGRVGFVRFYLVDNPGRSRIYELYAIGPHMETNSGAGGKFFNSFSVAVMPPTPGRKLPPGPRPRLK